MCRLLAVAALALAAIASAQQCTQNPSYRHFTVGNITGVVVSDGPIRLPGNFFSVPDEAVARSYARLFRPTAPLVWQQNVAVLDTPAGRLLVDTGALNVPAPPFAAAGQLVPNLVAVGIEPASIDAILLTHGHPDHVSGLLDRDGARAFPKARVYVSDIEHDFWTADPFVNPRPEVTALDNFAAIYKSSLAPYEGRITLVQDGSKPLPGVKYLLTPGHSPGHSTIVIKSGKQKLFCVGDAWFSQPDQVRNPEWTRPVETNGLDGFNSRVKLMDKLSKNGALVLAFHEDFPGLGHIINTAESYDWIPARTEMLATVQGSC